MGDPGGLFYATTLPNRDPDIKFDHYLNKNETMFYL